jgi:hypothetical protein
MKQSLIGKGFSPNTYRCEDCGGTVAGTYDVDKI